MKNLVKSLLIIALLSAGNYVQAQDDTMPKQETQAPQDNYQVETLFKSGKRASGGYGAITNKFTTINGKYANLAGVYGGWYINHRFLLGVGAAALTNNIRVPLQHRTDPNQDLSYMYGQVGLMPEYVIASNKTVHVAFSLFSGAGFTTQYERNWEDWEDNDDDDFDWDEDRDCDWFVVIEPGVQVEINVFKWMRFCPGISYRQAFGVDGRGLTDNAVSDISYNATLKFGKF